jgi:nicotinamidase/pyrazinamidase
MQSPKKILLIIDPQNDFCDLPVEFCPEDPLSIGQRIQPSLPVVGAHQDMMRIAALIDAVGDRYDAIVVTLDTHSQNDVAHPAFWVCGNGAAVEPFTEIVAVDVMAGRYVPRNPDELPVVLAMLEQLEAQGRYKLRIWPTHCEQGTWGSNVHVAVRAAYNAWELRTNRRVIKVIKGTNPFTEHYSAIRAEVPMENDPATQINSDLLELMLKAEEVDIAGEAGPICVKETTKDILVATPPEQRGKYRLLTDCMSSVTGFEQHFAEFIEGARSLGVQIMTSIDVLEETLEGVEK